MKKFFALFIFGLFLTTAAWAQLPSAEVKTVDGKTFDTKNIQNDGKPIIISFWATWCKPCIKELNAIQDHYEEWQKKTGVKLIAISIDDERTKTEVGPRVATNEWEYEVYIDVNSDFKRAMNVINVPHSFLIDGNGKIVSQHTTYAAGDELVLYEELKKLTEEKKVEEKKSE